MFDVLSRNICYLQKEKKSCICILDKLVLGYFCLLGLGMIAEWVGKRDNTGGDGFLREIMGVYQFQLIRSNNKAKGS
jgi:hypothetical protein